MAELGVLKMEATMKEQVSEASWAKLSEEVLEASWAKLSEEECSI